MQLLSVLRCMKIIVLKTEVTFYMLVDSQKSCCVHTLLPLPSKTKLTHFLTHYQSISSSASLSVSQVSVASYSGGGERIAALLSEHHALVHHGHWTPVEKGKTTPPAP